MRSLAFALLFALGARSALAQEREVFRSRTFAEAIVFGELPSLPGESFQGGILYQVEFFVNRTPTKRLFWASCAGDGKNGLPLAYTDGGDRVLFPWVSCTIAPYSRRIGEGEAGDMTDSSRPLTVFYDRNAADGMRNDVKVYAVGFRRGEFFEVSERFRFFASLTANLIGARVMQFAEGEGEAAAFQPLALGPETGFVWNLDERATLTFSAFGAQGHWGIGPAQGRFAGRASDLMYFSKARFDFGDRVSIAAEYDWYRFNGQGLKGFNAFVVGAKFFTTNWFRRGD
jgi:hypothetical protein